VEAFDESWIFAVFMWVFVLMLIVTAIKDYRARRKLPNNHHDRRTNRKLAFENLKFFLGIKDKDDRDTPMKNREGDKGTLFK